MLRFLLIVVIILAMMALVQGKPMPDGTVISSGGTVISQQRSYDGGLLGLGRK